MTDSFEKWIMGMSEEQYDNWLDDDATSAQEEKALNIRQRLSEEELEDMEREQEFIPSRVIEVGDNRELPPIKRDVTILIPQDKRSIPTIQTQKTITPVQPQPRIQPPAQPQVARPQRIGIVRRGISRIAGFFKRRKNNAQEKV